MCGKKKEDCEKASECTCECTPEKIEECHGDSEDHPCE